MGQRPHHEIQGNIPLPCHTYSANIFCRKTAIIGWGENAWYWNRLRYLTPGLVLVVHYIHHSGFFASTTENATALYQNKIWVLSGGNGLQALKDA